MYSNISICISDIFTGFFRLWNKIMHEHKQCLYQAPLTEEYLVCIGLMNIYNCEYGGQISKKFNCAPPTTEEYLASAFL